MFFANSCDTDVYYSYSKMKIISLVLVIGLRFSGPARAQGNYVNLSGPHSNQNLLHAWLYAQVCQNQWRILIHSLTNLN